MVALLALEKGIKILSGCHGFKMVLCYNRPMKFLIEKDGQEYHAYSPEIPGCHTHGRTIDEATANLKEAVSLYLEDTLDNVIIEAKKSQELAQ